jgi:hypothetical protein
MELNEAPPRENPRNVVGQQLQHWQALRAQLEQMEDIDEQALLDTLDGETNLHEVLLQLEEEIHEREALAEVIDLRIKVLHDRRERVQKTADTLRNIVLQAMDTAGIPKIQGVSATLSVRQFAPEAIIEDESLIPSEYFKARDPVLDKKAINAAVKEGAVIPGVSMSNGKISLTIRRK